MRGNWGWDLGEMLSCYRKRVRWDLLWEAESEGNIADGGGIKEVTLNASTTQQQRKLEY